MRRRHGQGAARRRGDRSKSHRQGKKGAKRSVLTEGSGVPIGLAAAGANRHDQKLLVETIESIPIARPEPTEAAPQGICLDAAYDAPAVLELVAGYGLTPHVRSRGEERELKAREQGFRARRWVVEGCHSWLNRFRGLLVRWCKKAANHRALMQLACGIIAWRRARADGLAR